MNKQSVVCLLLLAFITWQFPNCNGDRFADKNIQEGYELSKKYCVSCHQYPEPSLINKKTWEQFVLPKMAHNLGYMYFLGGYVEEGRTQTITIQQWDNILRYYLSQAPDSPLKREKDITPIKKQTALFTTTGFSIPLEQPATTMVKIDTGNKRILFADGLTGYLYTVSPELVLSDSLKDGIGISNVKIREDGLWILSMGVLHPTDFRSGHLVITDRGFHKNDVLIDSLQRPVHATYTDLNNDSLEDIVICEFGDQHGSLCWFENKGNNSYTRHYLRPFPGAVKSVVKDFNNDGRPDIMALMAQADEGLFIYYNEGNGTFREERLMQFPPSHGSNYFEVTDFNNDGFPDVMITNGDNGDYPPILKAYHGIRIYLNDGKNHFTEKLFLPVNGVCKAIAADFDGDGDLDIASIAYFPDFKHTPEEGFIYWENKGEWQYAPSSIDKVTEGRWLTMDAGDLDGDGDIDIILGNADFRLGDIPPVFKEKWDGHSPSLLILKNNLH